MKDKPCTIAAMYYPEDVHNHFCLSASFHALAEVAARHDREAYIRASDLLDMTASILLRGISFLDECLETYEYAPPMQAQLARSTIREIAALCAELADIECNASSYRKIMEQQSGAS